MIYLLFYVLHLKVRIFKCNNLFIYFACCLSFTLHKFFFVFAYLLCACLQKTPRLDKSHAKVFYSRFISMHCWDSKRLVMLVLNAEYHADKPQSFTCNRAIRALKPAPKAAIYHSTPWEDFLKGSWEEIRSS